MCNLPCLQITRRPILILGSCVSEGWRTFMELISISSCYRHWLVLLKKKVQLKPASPVHHVISIVVWPKMGQYVYICANQHVPTFKKNSNINTEFHNNTLFKNSYNYIYSLYLSYFQLLDILCILLSHTHTCIHLSPKHTIYNILHVSKNGSNSYRLTTNIM